MLKLILPMAIALAAGGFYYFKRHHKSEMDLEVERAYETGAE